MNELGMKEKTLVAIVAMVVLYAVAVATWFMSAESSWRKAAKAYAKAKDTYARECKLIAEKRKWTEAYETEKAAMPTFGAGKATDTTWLELMDNLAVKHKILISQRQAGKEIEADEVYELPIEVRSWEGSLPALVRFMHELENPTEGMFDITQINLKPSSRRGYLRGSFTLNCAYMREQ